jgi:ABC-type glycerol-3-phosphate transport system permease component
MLGAWIKKIVLHAVLIVICAVWCYPFLWMTSAGFKTQREMFANGLNLIPSQPTLDNLIRAWEAARFEVYFMNTVIVTISVVCLVILLSSMAGYGLGRGNMPGKKMIIGLLVATMFLPKSVTMLPLFSLILALGLNNTLFGIIVAEAAPAHVTPILLFIGFFSGVPKELEEAAVMDGARAPYIYARIMLPLAKPLIATVGIFNFVGSWNAFMIPLILTLNKPELRTLGVGMYAFFGEDSIDWTGLSAGALITVVPIIVVFMFFQKYFVRGLEGAIKG